MARTLGAAALALSSAAAAPFALNFAPAPAANGFNNASLRSWGGGVIAAGGAFHLFASAFVGGCGLSSWGANSVAIHAVGPTPTGPFAFVERALPFYHHNVAPIMAPDGTLLIFAIGMFPDPVPATCRPGAPNVVSGHGFETVEAWSAPGVAGPWSPVAGAAPNGRNLFNGTNPAPAFDPSGNGTLYVMSHDAHGFTVSAAASWRGPYSAPRAVFPSTFPSSGFAGEDPFLWWNPNINNAEGGVGAWSALFHAYNSSDTKHQFAVGGYAQSAGRDVFGAWTVQDPAASPAYTTVFETFVKGDAGPTETTTFSRRERPKLLFDARGAPSVLYNGVCPEPPGNGACFTIAAPLKQA